MPPIFNCENAAPGSGCELNCHNLTICSLSSFTPAAGAPIRCAIPCAYSVARALNRSTVWRVRSCEFCPAMPLLLGLLACWQFGSVYPAQLVLGLGRTKTCYLTSSRSTEQACLCLADRLFIWPAAWHQDI